MISPTLIEERIWRGLGRAAGRVGLVCSLFRARGAENPLAPACRVMALPAAFAPHRGGFARSPGYGEALWQGVFDGARVRAGDFILRPESRPGAADGGVWFVASLPPLLPPLCVRAQRLVSLSRPAAPVAAGTNPYGGTGEGEFLLKGWPASVLDSAGAGAYQASLPTGTALTTWTMLLTTPNGVVIEPGDHTSDDLGRSGIIAAAELSELGWRLRVTQAAT